ncbi:hypothetical protein ABPG72_008892 [Tetrahymena utriculariae]
MKNNTLSQNTALIGGGTRYINKQPKVFSMQNYQQILQKLNSNKFYQNQAKLYGQNIGSYPVNLDIKNTFQDDNRRDIPLIQNVQSRNTTNPIIVRLIDEEMREIRFFQQNEISHKNLRIQQEYQYYLLSIESSEVGLQGDMVQKYDFEKFGFTFNVKYSCQPNNSSSIMIKSISKIPTLDSKSLNFNNELHQVQLNQEFRHCQKGDIIKSFDKFQLCYKCQKGFYSLEDPHLKPNLQCQKCPQGSLDCHSNVIQLQNGYWRMNEDSDILVQCKNSEYCKPEESDNINGCTRGHFGVLCESCDLNGQVWGQRYGKSYDGSTCQVCTNKLLSLSIGFLALFLFFQWFTCYFRSKDNTPFYKVNYFQFLSLLNSFGIPTIDYLPFFQLSGGDRLQLTIYNLNCAYSYFISYLPLYGFKVVWANIQVILILITGNFLYSLFFSERFSISTSSLTLVYLFYSSSMIKILTQLASCSFISGQYYIQLELNRICYTSQHINLLQKIVAPLLILQFLIILLIFLSLLIKSKRNLKNINMLNQYGHLYQDQKSECFYWEKARNQFRALLVQTANFQHTHHISFLLELEQSSLINFTDNFLFHKRFLRFDFYPLDQSQACLYELKINRFQLKNLSIFSQNISKINISSTFQKQEFCQNEFPMEKYQKLNQKNYQKITQSQKFFITQHKSVQTSHYGITEISAKIIKQKHQTECQVQLKKA